MRRRDLEVSGSRRLLASPTWAAVGASAERGEQNRASVLRITNSPRQKANGRPAPTRNMRRRRRQSVFLPPPSVARPETANEPNPATVGTWRGLARPQSDRLLRGALGVQSSERACCNKNCRGPDIVSN